MSEIVSDINDLPAVGRSNRARHEHYYTPYILRIQCIRYIEEFFGNFFYGRFLHIRVVHIYHGQQEYQLTTVDTRTCSGILKELKNAAG